MAHSKKKQTKKKKRCGCRCGKCTCCKCCRKQKYGGYKPFGTYVDKDGIVMPVSDPLADYEVIMPSSSTLEPPPARAVRKRITPTLVPSNLEPPVAVAKPARKRISATLVTPNLEPPTVAPVGDDFFGLAWNEDRDKDLTRRLYFSQLGEKFVEKNYPSRALDDDTADILWSWTNKVLKKKLGDSKALQLLDSMMK